MLNFKHICDIYGQSISIKIRLNCLNSIKNHNFVVVKASFFLHQRKLNFPKWFSNFFANRRFLTYLNAVWFLDGEHFAIFWGWMWCDRNCHFLTDFKTEKFQTFWQNELFELFVVAFNSFLCKKIADHWLFILKPFVENLSLWDLDRKIFLCLNSLFRLWNAKTKNQKTNLNFLT